MSPRPLSAVDFLLGFWTLISVCIANNIGTGRGRHRRNSSMRETLSYVFAANGLEGEKDGKDRERGRGGRGRISVKLN